LLAGVLVYAGICAAMFGLQRSLQYRPDARPLDPALATRHGLVQQTLATPDGESLQLWWAAPTDATAPVYLYLHGNGANLAARAARLGAMRQSGAGVLALSWRGYGGSSGSPSEAGFMTDARSGWQELQRRLPGRRLIIVGESLGSTVAVMLAAEVRPAAVVLDSSFDSALALAREAYPWLPVTALLRDGFRADLAAPRVQAPVLQVHCRDDPVSPLSHAQALRRLLPQPALLHIVEDRCHVPSLLAWNDVLQAFVESP
jgi:pimeloyl-ACP methyl ester carboxylesterase